MGQLPPPSSIYFFWDFKLCHPSLLRKSIVWHGYDGICALIGECEVLMVVRGLYVFCLAFLKWEEYWVR